MSINPLRNYDPNNRLLWLLTRGAGRDEPPSQSNSCPPTPPEFNRPIAPWADDFNSPPGTDNQGAIFPGVTSWGPSSPREKFLRALREQDYYDNEPQIISLEGDGNDDVVDESTHDPYDLGLPKYGGFDLGITFEHDENNDAYAPWKEPPIVEPFPLADCTSEIVTDITLDATVLPPEVEDVLANSQVNTANPLTTHDIALAQLASESGVFPSYLPLPSSGLERPEDVGDFNGNIVFVASVSPDIPGAIVSAVTSDGNSNLEIQPQSIVGVHEVDQNKLNEAEILGKLDLEFEERMAPIIEKYQRSIKGPLLYLLERQLLSNWSQVNPS